MYSFKMVSALYGINDTEVRLMTDWLMVIITAIYVIATILICVFNGKSAKAANEQTQTAKKQIDEMLRQYNETNRPIVSVRFEIIRSGVLCFIVENIGPLPATDVRINVNEEFITNVEEIDPQARIREATEATLFLAPKQKVTILIGSQVNFTEYAKVKTVFDISYNGLYHEQTMINLDQYKFMLMYNSETEDIAQHLKKLQEDSKKFHSGVLKSLDKRRPVSVLVHSENDSWKFKIYKEVCTNRGTSAEAIATKLGISRETVLNLLLELDHVDGFVQYLPVDDNDYSAEWYKR